MAPAQALAHCSGGIQMALGDITPPRKLMGIAIGWAIQPMALRDDEPMRRNSPTVNELVIQDGRNLTAEKERLIAFIDRFSTAGPNSCTAHPHSFFGRLTPQEWAILMYKHLDHHLRQFGAKPNSAHRDQAGCALASSSSARPNAGRYRPKFNSKSLGTP
jgi:hypothetical protein